MMFTNNALLYCTFNLADEVILHYADNSTYSYSLYSDDDALFSLRVSVILMGHRENMQSLIPLSGQFQVKVQHFWFIIFICLLLCLFD